MPMPMAVCPIATMCSRVMEKPRSAIFLEPRIVVWLAGTLAVLLGIMLLTLAHFIGRSRSPS